MWLTYEQRQLFRLPEVAGYLPGCAALRIIQHGLDIDLRNSNIGVPQQLFDLFIIDGSVLLHLPYVPACPGVAQAVNMRFSQIHPGSASILYNGPQKLDTKKRD